MNIRDLSPVPVSDSLDVLLCASVTMNEVINWKIDKKREAWREELDS